MTYTDIYGFEHEDSVIISKEDDFKRIFIIEDQQHRRFECLKPNPPMVHNSNVHWHRDPSLKTPDNYWDSFEQ